MLRLRYGISYILYDEMFTQQNGLCFLCGKPEGIITKYGKVRALAVDHDRSCCPGKQSCGRCIRALLCFRCNTAIGKFNDDPVLIRKVAEYIDEYRICSLGKDSSSQS